MWGVTTPEAVQSLQNGINQAGGSTIVGLHLATDNGQQADRFEASWNGFLRLYNLLQFVPECYPVSSEAEAFKGYDELLGTRTAPAPNEPLPAGKSFDEEEWEEAREFAIEEVGPLLDYLYEETAPAPSVPYELMRDGEIVATAELGWEESQVAVLASNQKSNREAFEDKGWTVFSSDEVTQEPGPVLRALRDG